MESRKLKVASVSDMIRNNAVFLSPRVSLSTLAFAHNPASLGCLSPLSAPGLWNRPLLFIRTLEICFRVILFYWKQTPIISKFQKRKSSINLKYFFQHKLNEISFLQNLGNACETIFQIEKTGNVKDVERRVWYFPRKKGGVSADQAIHSIVTHHPEFPTVCWE